MLQNNIALVISGAPGTSSELSHLASPCSCEEIRYCFHENCHKVASRCVGGNGRKREGRGMWRRLSLSDQQLSARLVFLHKEFSGTLPPRNRNSLTADSALCRPCAECGESRPEAGPALEAGRSRRSSAAVSAEVGSQFAGNVAQQFHLQLIPFFLLLFSFIIKAFSHYPALLLLGICKHCILIFTQCHLTLWENAAFRQTDSPCRRRA